MQKEVTANEIIELVKRLPNADSHIHEWAGKQCITTEWLVGNFAGCSFEYYTLERSADEMIKYLYEHLGHNSMVGNIVTKSGFPDLKAVERYCTPVEVEGVEP